MSPDRTLHRELAADLASVTSFLDESQAFIDACGLEGRAAYATELALEELLTNVVKYAYRGAPDDSRRVVVDVRVGADGVAVEVADRGDPFDPTAERLDDLPESLDERRVGGLGLRLVRTFARDVAYRREGGRNVVTVTLDRT